MFAIKELDFLVLGSELNEIIDNRVQLASLRRPCLRVT